MEAIIPKLIQLKDYINEESNVQTVDPIVTVVSVLIGVYFVQAVLTGLFSRR